MLFRRAVSKSMLKTSLVGGLLVEKSSELMGVSSQKDRRLPGLDEDETC